MRKDRKLASKLTAERFSCEKPGVASGWQRSAQTIGVVSHESVKGLWSFEGCVAGAAGPLETALQRTHRYCNWLVLAFDDVRAKYLHMKDTVRLPTAETLFQLRFPSSFRKKDVLPRTHIYYSQL